MKKFTSLIMLCVAAVLVAGCSSTAGTTKPEPKASGQALVAAPAANAPIIDGNPDDAAWQAASPMSISLDAEKGVKAQKITIKALYDDKNVYFLAEYSDSSPLKFNKAWEYDGTSWREGSYDDSLTFVWNMNDSIEGFNEKGFGALTKGLKKGDDIFDFADAVSGDQLATGTADYWGW